MMKRWSPTPPLSLALFVVWLLLNQSLDAATLLLAALLAIAVPLLTQGLRPVTARLRRPGLAFRAVLSYDGARRDITARNAGSATGRGDQEPSQLASGLKSSKSPAGLVFHSHTCSS